jgi:hypothetical protein
MYEKGKPRPVENIPRMGEGRIEEKDERGEFNYDMLLELW